MPSGRPIRILIVDDSAVMRSLLRSVIATDARLEAVGTASDGAAALRATDALRPDLILLDVEMPVMDGLDTLRQMRGRGLRIPVIMCSSLTQRGAQVTIEALASGAADYVAKPSGQPSRDAAVIALANDLIPKILILTTHRAPVYQAAPAGLLANAAPVSGGAAQPSARSNLLPWAPPVGSTSSGSTSSGASASFGSALAGYPVNPQAAANLHQPITIRPAVLLIGVSTGGPAALDVVLPALPANFPLPILVVQHMPELFTRLLAERLNTRCALAVREAEPGAPVLPGTIHIAKGNWHMDLVQPHRSQPPTLRLHQEAAENHCRPAVDVLFRSAVPVYGSSILAVVLTGMGSDGLIGSRLIREHGGAVLVQDQATSAVWGMPGVVAQAGLAQRILPLNAITPEILRLTGRTQHEASALRESAV